jgi:hypothetical protein
MEGDPAMIQELIVVLILALVWLQVFIVIRLAGHSHRQLQRHRWKEVHP